MVARQRSAHRCTWHTVPESRHSNSFSHFTFLHTFRQSLPAFINHKSGRNQAGRSSRQPTLAASLRIFLKVFCTKMLKFCDCPNPGNYQKTSRFTEDIRSKLNSQNSVNLQKIDILESYNFKERSAVLTNLESDLCLDT